MEDPIDEIMTIYVTLSEFDKGRLFQAMKMSGPSAAEPVKRKPGRPAGARSKPNGNAPAAVEPGAPAATDVR